MSAGRRSIPTMSAPLPLPGPCALCGHRAGVRTRTGALSCALCAWRFGDVPDDDLPLPRIDVVYYLRYDRRVKIGTSRRPRQRLASIRHDELLAFERGDRALEQSRHREFAELREGGEWFTLAAPLDVHVAALRRGGDPWHQYARWLSAELRR